MQVYKAAKYIRLSYTDDKSNESNSVGNQRKLIEDFVSRHPEIELVSEKAEGCHPAGSPPWRWSP